MEEEWETTMLNTGIGLEVCNCTRQLMTRCVYYSHTLLWPSELHCILYDTKIPAVQQVVHCNVCN